MTIRTSVLSTSFAATSSLSTYPHFQIEHPHLLASSASPAAYFKMSFFESQTPGWAQTQPGREQSYEAPQGPFGIPTVKAGHKKQQERGLTLVLGTSSPSPPVDASAFNAQFEGAYKWSYIRLVATSQKDAKDGHTRHGVDRVHFSNRYLTLIQKSSV